jgi:hypothetical protein
LGDLGQDVVVGTNSRRGHLLADLPVISIRRKQIDGSSHLACGAGGRRECWISGVILEPKSRTKVE